MKIIKSLLVFFGAGLLSLPCFADTKFYCPDPSSIQAVQYGPNIYTYFGVNENGIRFYSFNEYNGDAKTARALYNFNGAVYSRDAKVGDCYYIGEYMVEVGLRIATNPLNFKPVGGSWWSQDAEFYQCTSNNRHDCPFAVVSNK